MRAKPKQYVARGPKEGRKEGRTVEWKVGGLYVRIKGKDKQRDRKGGKENVINRGKREREESQREAGKKDKRE